MSTPPGYGPSSGIPGGDDFEPELEPEPARDRPAGRGPTPGRRSRPIDSGIPTSALDEAVLGPTRAVVEELPEGPDSPGDDLGKEPADRGTAVLLLLLATAVLLLFVAAQAAQFLSVLAGWPPVARAVGYAVAGVLGVMFAVSAIGLGWRYLVLPVSPGVRIDRPDDLAHRRSVQIQARRNLAMAKRRLREFLGRYPTDARHRRYLASIAGADRVDRLLSQRDRLMAHDHATDADWVRDFEDRFLAVLDELAGALVTRHAVAVGWKTAIVPTGFLDAMIVVANAYHLVGGLCRLYHLRADSWSTLKITAHVFGNTFVAARVEEFADQAAEESFNQMQDLINSQLARAFLSRVSSGVTQGTVNGLLLRRFGRFAVRSLRPIRR